MTEHDNVRTARDAAKEIVEDCLTFDDANRPVLVDEHGQRIGYANECDLQVRPDGTIVGVLLRQDVDRSGVLGRVDMDAVDAGETDE